jgi:phospholipid/cholesterol/gamma-HCH transport system substrate-binding protein
MHKNRLAAVGAFVIAGILLFAAGLFLIGNRRMMFSDTFEVYAEFSQVGGLQKGATVRVAGLEAGEVETIHLPTSPSGRFRVKLRVRADMHPIIRLDSMASIQNDGLVGNKFVQVEAGTDESPQVPDGGTIQSREPFDLADMLQRVNDTIDLVTTMITDVRVRLDDALQAVSTMAGEGQRMIADVSSEVQAMTSSGQKVAADLQTIVAGVRQGRGSLGKFVNDDAVYERVQEIASEAERAVTNLRQASESAKEAINDFRGEKGPMRGVVGDLQQSLTAARETLTDLADNSEALKRNFFFRGFFNRRGYFDLDDIGVEDYRNGALETKDRRVLRVWVSAEVLFAPDASGAERLTDVGRQRLDSAMAPFLRYPPKTPFVVEGYAGGATRDAQFVLSRSRALQVRDYLVGKFSMDPGHVATMPLGAQAPGSPANDRWEGVALAMFVATSPR